MTDYRWECVTENAAFARRDGAGALVFAKWIMYSDVWTLIRV